MSLLTGAAACHLHDVPTVENYCGPTRLHAAAAGLWWRGPARNCQLFGSHPISTSTTLPPGSPAAYARNSHPPDGKQGAYGPVSASPGAAGCSRLLTPRHRCAILPARCSSRPAPSLSNSAHGISCEPNPSLCEGFSVPREFAMKTEFYDTTLRDGSQQEGISLTVGDKLRIASLLDELGVDYVEVGWP